MGGGQMFISRGQSVSSSRTFVAKREKVISVENFAGGPLRGVRTTFMCSFVYNLATCVYSGC